MPETVLPYCNLSQCHNTHGAFYFLFTSKNFNTMFYAVIAITGSHFVRQLKFICQFLRKRNIFSGIYFTGIRVPTGSYGYLDIENSNRPVYNLDTKNDV